ncbi:MAG: WD40/YVTN/BNR-like repeat-containing protein [Polyangiaceae bacterium]
MSPRSAHANGRFPAAGQLVVSPADPSHLVLRTTYGLVLSNDTGQNWDWLCEKAVGYGAQVEDPSFAITADDSVVVSTFEGLAVSPDHGCSWSFAGPFTVGATAVSLFTDVAIHLDDPSHVLALVSQYASMLADGGFEYTNLIFASTDNGTTWSQVGSALDSTFIAETLDTAKSDPQRIYVSGIRGTGAAAVGVFLASTDGGQNFTESTIPLISVDEHAPYIGGVDPSDPDRVYVRIAGASSGRLLVSKNAGATFDPIFSGPPLLGFALSPDGSKVFVGSQNGLSEASSTDLTFTTKSSIVVQCLATSGSTLYACSADDPSGFILGSSTDDGATFTPLLHLNTLRGPLSCPQGTTANLCIPDWPSVAANLGETIDAGTDAGLPVPPPPSSNGCSCDLPSGRNAGLGAMGALVAAISTIAIRRKRKR